MSWIIFKIKNKRVDQMSSGAGEVKIKAFRTCLAYQHGVPEAEVHLELENQRAGIQNQNSVTSSELVKRLKVEMTRNVFKN